MERPKLLDRMRAVLRTRHYSIRTEDAYVQWVKRFILFHGKKHPSEMGSEEINEYLTHLAVERHLSASTQSQALAAILFLYRDVLGEEVPWLTELVRAPRRERAAARRARGEVSECECVVVMAVGIPCGKAQHRSAKRNRAEASSGGAGHPARCARRGAVRGDCEGGDAAHASPLLRHAPSGVGP